MRLGVDIGGTKVETALVDEQGNILQTMRRPIQIDKGKDKALENIFFVIKPLVNKEVETICLSSCGVIRKGKFIYSPNTPCLIGVDVVGKIKNKFGKKVLYDNDANCFTLAEQRFGAAKGHKNVVGVVIGTGIGSGIIIDGKIYSGKEGFAGEIGRNFINGEEFEALCSGPSIVRRYLEAGGKITKPNPKKIFLSDELIAKKIVNETYDYLARGFSLIINTLNPDIIVVGGGVSNILLYERLNQDVKKYSVKPCLILKNKLGDSSGVIGATLLD